jgi:hypothetical protein
MAARRKDGCPIFRRPNSQLWYCQASVGGKQRRMSTKRDSLKLAEGVTKDWFLTLQGTLSPVSSMR